jgi:hypothetical protein
MENNKMALIGFNPGMTDIMNCLALISYYSKKYNKIFIVIKPEHTELCNFYIRNMINTEIIYHYYQEILNIPHCDILVHGYDDYYRRDKYHFTYWKRDFNVCFVRNFYEMYDIPYITRIEYFELSRDIELENKVYDAFINSNCPNGEKYILYHGIDQSEINNENNCILYKLDHTTNIFFDTIKVLENAYELHFLDSVWGCMCYLLDAKYSIFKNTNIKIYLHAKRGYTLMFTEPIKLDNWTII